MIRATADIEGVLEKLRGYNSDGDEALVRSAYEYAVKAHEGQRRRSGEAYVVHPLRVSHLIAELKLDVPSICAGLLHDCVEDTPTSLEELKKLFGAEVSFLVDGVTKLGKLRWKTREEQQAESFRKMLVAMARDIRVILIKLADRMDNMRTLEAMPPDRQEGIAQETMDIYAPLANRLGIYWMRAELEDLSFRYTNPGEHESLINDLASHERERQRYTRKVEGILRKTMARHGVRCTVKGRLKNLWGIYGKMRRGRDLDQIHDIVAFRIITGSIQDCYAALGVAHEQFVPIPGRFKDYIAMPKPNRYQSLHTSVVGPEGERMEVQIRTDEMHRVAEEGIAAHWIYKDGRGEISPEDKKKFGWLRQLVEFQHDLKDPTEFINAVKIDLFSDEVYVFTPKGDVRAYPKGSTPVDFAYSIHTEVGQHCAGARVNNLIVPLRYKLRNGDRVDIITNPNQRPNKDWLKFVVSARARSKIRHYIRREQRERGREMGRDMLDKAFRKKGASLTKLQKKGELKKGTTAMRLGTDEELFMQVGFGRITAQQVVDAVLPQEEDGKPVRKPARERIAEVFERVRPRSTSGILVQDVDNLVVRIAHCCNPVPGDRIMGFITRGRGVTIHKVECPRALDLDPARRIEVSWDERAKVEHPVALRVHTTDRPGLLAKMSQAFSDLKVNIQSADCRATADARAVNTFHFSVYNLDDLKRVMKALQRIRGVYSVERI